jgi:sialic acid synthase SpsE
MIKKNELNSVYVIAEIGINHEGSVTQCAQMIDEAALIGVDAIKLQTINADSNYVFNSESYKIFKGSELTRSETAEMFTLAKSHGLDIFTTAGDIETINWVDKLNPSCWKVSSGLLTHTNIVRYLASLGRPLLISTGMANDEEIDFAMKTARSEGNNDISLLQCTSLYPAPFDSINLKTIKTLKSKYKCNVGFSDHSIGIDAAFLSVGAGATIIEKHFSLDPTRPSFDHRISLNAEQFKEMIQRIRLAEKIMGSSSKILSTEIKETRKKFLRSIVAIKDISKGEKLSASNIGVKRTLLGRGGSEPKYFDDLLGLIATKDFKINDPITIEEIS